MTRGGRRSEGQDPGRNDAQRPPLGPDDPKRDLETELEFHLEMETRRLIARGVDAEEARWSARARLGDLGKVRSDYAELAEPRRWERRVELLGEVVRDLAFGLRLLRRSPQFTLMALLTLAVGIGTATAIFSVVEAVLLRSLPYREADRIMVVSNGTGPSRQERTAVAAAEFADLLEQSRAFDALAAVRTRPAALDGGCGAGSDCEVEQVMEYAVSPGFFELLGVSPELGRFFAAEEGGAEAPGVVVLSHRLWLRRFGGDPAVVGRSVTLGGQVRTVVGVVPAEALFPDAPVAFLRERPDAWTPTSWERFRADSRGNQYLAVFGRVRPGGTFDEARQDLDRIAAGFREAFPDRYTRNASWKLIGVPMVDDMVGEARPVLLALLASVGVILLIACANIANLLLARGASRMRELSVRRALGAGRARIVRQLLIEAVLLAALGGALGVLLAWGAVPQLVKLDPGTLPRFDTTRVNPAVLAFSLLVTLAAGTVFGLAPALRFTGRGALLADDGARGAGAGAPRRRVRSLLVVAEVGLALVLLIVSTLLVRTTLALQRVPTGVRSEGVLTFQVSLPQVRYDSAYKRAAFHEQAQDALLALSTEGASGVYPLPMSGDGWSGSYHVEGQAVTGAEPPHGEFAAALPGYFGALGIPLLEGRDFARDDRAGAPSVVIVDEELARRHWPGESALGKRVSQSSAEGPWAAVVGVVAHVRAGGPLVEGEPQIYFPLLQRPQTVFSYVVRAPAAPEALSTSVRAAVAGVDRGIPLSRVRTMDAVVAGATSRQRFTMLLFILFGGTALALAAAGLYGVMAYLVAQRSAEIGVRLALGGTRADVLRLILGESLTMTGAGVALGLLGALLATRVVAGLLYGVQPFDPATYAGIALLLTLVSLLASWAPAMRAARIDPVETMRK